jgi:hypothetical protein
VNGGRLDNLRAGTGFFSETVSGITRGQLLEIYPKRVHVRGRLGG